MLPVSILSYFAVCVVDCFGIDDVSAVAVAVDVVGVTRVVVVVYVG